MAGYHVENFGCRASRADGEGIAAGLQSLGLEAAGLASAAVVILNTCSVTAEADKDARAFVRKAKRLNPSSRVVVTGCYAQRAPVEVAALPGVDRVIGNSHKSLVAEIASGMVSPRNVVPLHQLLEASSILVDDTFAHSDIAVTAPLEPSPSTRTRPNLKIQDGCGNRCSFCVIPQTRGGSRSIPMTRVLEDVCRFVDGGGQEMVLSGINLGRWGRDLQPQQRFEDLVEAILLQTKLPRLRISSVEPMDWTDRLIELFAAFSNEDQRLARHIHLPLQSGSDEILRAMYRRYRPWHYAAKLATVHQAISDAAIGADVMVGFPGETDALFAETYRFIEQQPFTYLHLFPFSARPGTAAWTLQQEKPVPGEAVKERMAGLRSLADAKHKAFCARFVGRELSVVTLQTSEEDRAIGVTRALSDNFLSIELKASLPANRMLRAKITGATAGGLSAQPIDCRLHGKITKRPEPGLQSSASQMLY